MDREGLQQIGAIGGISGFLKFDLDGHKLALVDDDKINFPAILPVVNLRMIFRQVDADGIFNQLACQRSGSSKSPLELM